MKDRVLLFGTKVPKSAEAAMKAYLNEPETVLGKLLYSKDTRRFVNSDPLIVGSVINWGLLLTKDRIDLLKFAVAHTVLYEDCVINITVNHYEPKRC